MKDARFVLTLNGGSSTLKFALYSLEGAAQRRLRGQFDRLDRPGTGFRFEDASGAAGTQAIGQSGHREAAGYLFDWLDRQVGLTSLAAIGHRVVNGGTRYRQPMLVTDEMLVELRQISAYAPEHLPSEIAMIELCRERLPQLPQVACFDSAFHRGMPAVARTIPIPRRYMVSGVERYGFHGLSYTFLMQALQREAGMESARGRVILAHLGHGASLAAVHQGRSIDTSMGFTPAAGVPMGTRAGDLDPGLILYFAQTEGMDARAFHRMVNRESGLLGISGTSSDLRDLLDHETSDVRAAEAVAVFCYGVKKCIGAFAAALGGLDTLVFSGGIGENSAVIRERICGDLGFLGIELDPGRNQSGAPVISKSGDGVDVRVIATDEEVVIVAAVAAILGSA
ncbi:MAG: acetate/propionate family kinase [Cucumibacter sp.]